MPEKNGIPMASLRSQKPIWKHYAYSSFFECCNLWGILSACRWFGNHRLFCSRVNARSTCHRTFRFCARHKWVRSVVYVFCVVWCSSIYLPKLLELTTVIQNAFKRFCATDFCCASSWMIAESILVGWLRQLGNLELQRTTYAFRSLRLKKKTMIRLIN